MQSNVNIAWRGTDGAGFQYGYYREGEKQYRVDISLPGRGFTPRTGRTRCMCKARRSGRRIRFRAPKRWRASFFRFKAINISTARSRAPSGGWERCCTPWPAVFQAGERRPHPSPCRLRPFPVLNRGGGSLAGCSPATEAAGDERQ